MQRTRYRPVAVLHFIRRKWRYLFQLTGTAYSKLWQVRSTSQLQCRHLPLTSPPAAWPWWSRCLPRPAPGSADARRAHVGVRARVRVRVHVVHYVMLVLHMVCTSTAQQQQQLMVAEPNGARC